MEKKRKEGNGMEKKKKEGNGDGRERIKIETVEVKKEI